MSFLTLSVKQPWANLIVDGYKTIENRSWLTTYRGAILIQASQKFDKDWKANSTPGTSQFVKNYVSAKTIASVGMEKWNSGNIIGACIISDVTTHRCSKWCMALSKYYFRLIYPIAFRKPIKCDGKLKLFDANISKIDFNASDRRYYYELRTISRELFGGDSPLL